MSDAQNFIAAIRAQTGKDVFSRKELFDFGKDNSYRQKTVWEAIRSVPITRGKESTFQLRLFR